MSQWLSAQMEFLADRTGVDRTMLDPTQEQIDAILDLAALAAHESGDRKNAPVFCYLIGVARCNGATLEELRELVRSTS